MTTPLRVLFLIENVPYSLDTRVRRESHALMSAGAEITVLALPAEADEARLADALALHPLAPRQGLGDVARELAGVRAERFALT